LRDPPLVYTEHSVWPGYRPAVRWANALTFRRNDRVFAVADEVARSIRPSMAPRGVETLYHGPDHDVLQVALARDGVRAELGVPETCRIVGSVANFTPQKAHGVMLEAIASVRRRFPDVRLVHVGGGDLEPDIRARVRSLGLERTVIFTGRRDDAVRFAAAFD